VSTAVRASVVVVSYNSAADLGTCLDALMPTLGSSDEAIVYDNASTDRSVEVASARGVRVVRSDANHGLGGGANRGAAAGRGQWIVFLNPDTMVEPGWLDALLAPLGEGPAMATPRIVLMDEPGLVDACGNAVHLSGITVCRGYGQPASSFASRDSLLAVSGAAFAIDRVTFDRLGGFDERFFMYLEDTDLSLRAALAGVPIWSVPTSQVRHRHVASFGPQKLYWLERNRYLMLLKVWRGRTLLALLPTLALVELLVWGYALLRGRAALAAKARAWLWLAEHPWRLVGGRRQAQARRRVADDNLLARCPARIDVTELVAAPALRWLVAVALAAPMTLTALAGRRLASRSAV
jgi:GT2 family glycosyltransferase